MYLVAKGSLGNVSLQQDVIQVRLGVNSRYFAHLETNQCTMRERTVQRADFGSGEHCREAGVGFRANKNWQLLAKAWNETLRLFIT